MNYEEVYCPNCGKQVCIICFLCYNEMGCVNVKCPQTYMQRKKIIEENIASLPTVSYDYIKSNIICSFSYWDIPLNGLVNYENERCFFECSDLDNVKYVIWKINWNDQCEEHIKDYETYYPHCFPSKNIQYNGWSMEEFTLKWKGRCPIIHSLNKRACIPALKGEVLGAKSR